MGGLCFGIVVLSYIGWLVLFSSLFFFSSRRRHTRSLCDWSSDVCSSDLNLVMPDVSGSTPVAKQIVVTATDNSNNTAAVPQDILVQPINDTVPPLLTLS